MALYAFSNWLILKGFGNYIASVLWFHPIREASTIRPINIVLSKKPMHVDNFSQITEKKVASNSKHFVLLNTKDFK